MTKSRNDPIESVHLTISIRADRETAGKIKELIPSARLREGSCELKLEGEQPAEVAQEAEEMMEKLREVVGTPKDFKNAEGSLGKK